MSDCVYFLEILGITQQAFHIESTSIRRPFYVDTWKTKFPTNFHAISTYFFDVISLIEKSTSFPRTFFDVILLIEKSTSLSRIFFDIILMVDISKFFPRTFCRCNFDVRKIHVLFNVISVVGKSTLFPLTFLELILMVEKYTLFACTFFYEISMGKNRNHTSAWVFSCKLAVYFQSTFY